jgi:primosomal protein N' (replication factor Y)
VKIARLFLKQKNKRLDHLYDYRIPEEMEQAVVPGVRVAVPFSLGNRMIEGFVFSVTDHSKYADKLRSIVQVIDQKPVVDDLHRRLCLWMVKIYDCLFYDALALFVQTVRVTRKADKAGQVQFYVHHRHERYFQITPEGRKADVRGKKMSRIVELLKRGPKSESEINAAVKNASDSRKRLLQRSWIEETDESVSCPRETVNFEDFNDQYTDTKQIVEDILRTGNKPVFFYQLEVEHRFEIFLRAAAAVVKNGRTAFIIEPEINLTQKLLKRFKSVFGDSGAVFHSGLKISEKNQIGQHIQNGRIKIVLGSRAALFLPLKNIGMIGLDEVCSALYVSDSEPHYKLPVVAAQLAKWSDALFLMSDPVPSVELKWRIQAHQIAAVSSEADYHSIDIVDMQKEMRSGNLSIFSHAAEKGIEQALQQGEKSLLLHNRLGFQQVVFCRDCGEVIKCSVCGRPMKTDQGQRLICMTCGSKMAFPQRCPKCGGPHIKGMGVGVEQVEAVAKQKWPEADILKIDAEAIQQYGFAALNARIAHANLIIGTRSLLRHFDFGTVGCAVAVLIDQDMDLNAYNAAEQTYRLYRLFFEETHACCRLIQTYQTQHAVVQALSETKDALFYEAEIQYRERMNYPPFGHLVYFKIFGKNEKQVKQDSYKLYQAVKKQFLSWTVYQPVFNGIRREQQQIEYRIILKAPSIPPVSNGIRKMIWAKTFENISSKMTMMIDPI